MKKLILGMILGTLSTLYAEESIDEYGGMLTLWPKDHGVFLFIDAQERVQGEDLEKPIRFLANDFNIAIKTIRRKNLAFDIHTASSTLHELGAKGGIWIVDDVTLPSSLIAPENSWGVINVAVLLAGNPDAKKIALRVHKLINRTFANLHGISDPIMMPGCVTKQAVGLDGIDALPCAMFSPEAQSKVSSYLEKAGYKRRMVGTYYDACEEGWAPAPTNAIQKSIWERVHALPTKPIKIVPPNQKK